MYLSNYSVRIPEGKEVQGGYVEIGHGERYRIILRNNNTSRCDARVEVDGKHVGTWRLDSHRGITLERSANDDGYFTFYLTGTPEAHQASVDYANPDLGLVRVTFTPEAAPRPITFRSTPFSPRVGEKSISDIQETRCFYTQTASLSTSQSAAPIAKGAPGGTGLSGHSSQRFVEVGAMELDLSRQVTINLRLIGPSDTPRPLVDASSNPVPPRVW